MEDRIVIAIFFFIGLAGIIVFIYSLTGSKGSKGGDSGGNGGGGWGGSGGGNCDSICQRWLLGHNKYRQSANYPPLKWDSTLAAQATEYASQLNSSGQFQHGDMCNSTCTGSSNCSNGRKCGQNLQKATGSAQTTPETSVTNWYNECSQYTSVPTSAPPPGSPEFGHYTQLMWKDAKRVGCGIVGNVSNCLYDQGNILGEFDSNVPSPGSCSRSQDIPGFSQYLVNNQFTSGPGTFDV